MLDKTTDGEGFLDDTLHGRLNEIALNGALSDHVRNTADQALTRLTELEDQKSLAIEFLEKEIVRCRLRIDDLLSSNNANLNRAREAEKRIAAREADIRELVETNKQMADKLVERQKAPELVPLFESEQEAVEAVKAALEASGFVPNPGMHIQAHTIDLTDLFGPRRQTPTYTVRGVEFPKDFFSRPRN